MIHMFFGERAASKISDVPKDTKVMDIKKAGIIGSGTMGGGKAMCFANAGIPVHIIDQDQDNLTRGISAIKRIMIFMVCRGKLCKIKRMLFLVSYPLVLIIRMYLRLRYCY